MLAKQIGIVICRIAAVVLILQVVRSMGIVLPGYFQGYGHIGLSDMLTLFVTFTPGFVAVVLWIFAERISTGPGGGGESVAEQRMSETDIIGVGTLIIGLYVVVMAFFSVVSTELAVYTLRDMFERNQGNELTFDIGRELARLNAARITNVVELVVGMALIVGRGSIARFLAKARRAGT